MSKDFMEIENNVENMAVKIHNLSCTAFMLAALCDSDSDYPSLDLIGDTFHHFADQLEMFSEMASDVARDILMERKKHETTKRA